MFNLLRLFVVRGKPEDVLPKLFTKFGPPKRPIPAPTMDDMKGITIPEKQTSVTELSDKVICNDVWTFI